MSRERTPAGNILALARSRKDQARDVVEIATSYMPTSIDLDTLMPDDIPQRRVQTNLPGTPSPDTRSPSKHQRSDQSVPKGRAPAAGTGVKRKRISLYLDDEVLTKIFRVSLERHEQLSSATLRLIIEALKARGL